jgi:diketogulonate reductase-like aldo/keto reductase
MCGLKLKIRTSHMSGKKAIERLVTLSNGAEMPVMGLGTLFHKDAKGVQRAISQVGYRHIDTA